MVNRIATRIAMWSGPRNISTAMMRSFENRPDCAVIDEPFYASYLASTGLEHPMRSEVLASQPTSPDDVIEDLIHDPGDGAAIQYQKHMTHHMLPDIDLDWLDSVINCFLIRSPDEIITSYLEKRDDVRESDLGLKRQVEIFNSVRQRDGKAPPVLDAADVLSDPKAMVGKLCERIGIAFTPQMLAWPAGRRGSDGVWAAHWYANVERSTGFARVRQAEALVPPQYSELSKVCREYYEELAVHKI